MWRRGKAFPPPRWSCRTRCLGRRPPSASGRRIRLDSRVLEWPEPAQRWIAAHEVYHAIAHGWREPGRWLTVLATVLAVGVGGWAAWLGGPGTGLITLTGAGLLILAATSWWTRRLEDQADRYAASDGRLDALDEDSLLELFVGEASVPRWRATHPRWTTRFPVGTARLPRSLRQLHAEVDAATPT